MHHILGKIDDLDTAIGNSADVTPVVAKKARDLIGGLRKFMERDLAAPAPGMASTVGGPTITQRPDLVYAETVRQAGLQSDAVSVTHVIPGNAGTIQAPAPLHPAEPAKIGTETR